MLLKHILAGCSSLSELLGLDGDNSDSQLLDETAVTQTVGVIKQVCNHSYDSSREFLLSMHFCFAHHVLRIGQMNLRPGAVLLFGGATVVTNGIPKSSLGGDLLNVKC